jgi:2-polyprenyl-3-methyl-5-hydroxy-6-metoxy-1,4-benzoquinol methylase
VDTVLPEAVPSPLTGQESGARLVKTLPVGPIAARYQSEYRYDPREEFAGLERVGLYECERTGFRFYYPFSTAGKEGLYRALEQFPWNYKETKWEHDTALGLIQAGNAVLDVGCGRGAFLDRAKTQRGAVVTGLEFNRSAAAVAASRGVETPDEALEQHAAARAGSYDVVTSFQVLEHVTDPRSFVAGCLRALKPEGLLLLGVPNNDAFIRLDPNFVLNGPPHHMGLWTRKSLAALCELFPLRLLGFEVEPLQETDWYQAVMERLYLPTRVQRSLYYRLGGAKLFQRFVEENADTIAGHTILATFQKLPT